VLTAAHCAAWAWGRKSPGPAVAIVPGPAAQGGSPYTSTTVGPPIVEMYVGGAWTDISQYVYYRDMITISRGRPDETSTIQPQTCTLTLNNRDGRFNPLNPLGPWYGTFARNVPLRVSQQYNGTRWPRFYGEVAALPTSSDQSATDVYCQITAAGMLRRINAGQSPLRSAMYRGYTATSALGSLPPSVRPVAYWPCEDGPTSTSIAAATPNTATMLITGSPSFAADSSYWASSAVPVLDKSSWRGTVGAATDNGTGWLVWCIIDVPAGDDATGNLLTITTVGSNVATIVVQYNPGGTLTFLTYDVNGTNLFTSGPWAFNLVGTPGLLIVGAVPQSGGSVLYEFIFIPQGDYGAFGIVNVTQTPANTGRVSTVTINSTRTMATTSVGQIAVSADAVTNTSGFQQSLINSWSGETPYNRFLRLSSEQGIPAIAVAPGTIWFDDVRMGIQDQQTFVELLQEPIATDQTIMYEARDQLALVYLSRASLYNQAPALTLDYAQNQLSAPPNPQYDDLNTRNDITITRNYGSTYELIQASGTMNVQNPPAGVGDYESQYEISLDSDTHLPDQAGWLLHLGTVDEPRYPSLSINLRHATFTGSVDMMNAALKVGIGSRIVINNVPGNQAASPVSVLVQGYTETLGVLEHDIVYNCTPESPYHVAILDDTVLGHADTDGSTLAADAAPGATTLSVATTGYPSPLSPLWTTAPADMPFDLAISGERVTVTAISGATSPQTFTVARAVNGVSKLLPAGSDVRLWQPMILGL